MHLKNLSFITLVLIFVINIGYVEARGGGDKKGGGGRDGGGRGGNSGKSHSGKTGGKKANHSANQNYSRAPTMSRSESSKNRPTKRPSQVERPVIKPEKGRLKSSEGSRKGHDVKPVEGGRDNTRNIAKDFLNKNKNNTIDKETLNKKKKDFHANRKERDKQKRWHAKNLRDRVNDKWHDHNHWFKRDFFDHHHYHPYYWNNNINWWRAASWTGLVSWFAWGWDNPIYYENGYYPIETTYYSYVPSENDSPTNTTIVIPPPINNGTTSNAAPSDSDEWYPLGVFAVGKDVILAADSNMFVQLAVNKNGDIAGTYYNATLDQAHEISGSVDRNTQQAAWQLVDKPNSPIISTGLYNLTQDSTEVRVEFSDGAVQTWTYVRLDN